jgi:hypothetical protein
VWHERVLLILVGGQIRPTKSWTKILAETLSPLLLGIDKENKNKKIFAVCTLVETRQIELCRGLSWKEHGEGPLPCSTVRHTAKVRNLGFCTWPE